MPLMPYHRINPRFENVYLTTVSLERLKRLSSRLIRHRCKHEAFQDHANLSRLYSQMQPPCEIREQIFLDYIVRCNHTVKQENLMQGIKNWLQTTG